MQQYDAVIIGGGPAGALTALRLARAGWMIALIEKRERHGGKTCGHCLHARSFESLARAGVFEDVKSRAVSTTSWLRVHGERGRVVQSTFSTDQSAQGLVVSRQVLDQLLIDRALAAGAHVIQPATAQPILSHRTAEIEVRHQATCNAFCTRLVIGADGVGSNVARVAGLASDAFSGRNYGCSFGIDTQHVDAIAPNTIELFITTGGYLGVVRETAGQLHVAARIGSATGRQSRDPLQFVRATALKHPALQSLGLHRINRPALLDFSAIGPIPWQPSHVANDRVALVGDAAGYIEPFTGEGMTWALSSAEVLCSVLVSARPGQWNQSMASEYAHVWKHEVGRRHWLCRAVAATLNHRRMTDACMSVANRWPALTDRVVKMVVAA